LATDTRVDNLNAAGILVGALLLHHGRHRRHARLHEAAADAGPVGLLPALERDPLHARHVQVRVRAAEAPSVRPELLLAAGAVADDAAVVGVDGGSLPAELRLQVAAQEGAHLHLERGAGRVEVEVPVEAVVDEAGRPEPARVAERLVDGRRRLREELELELEAAVADEEGVLQGGRRQCARHVEVEVAAVFAAPVPPPLAVAGLLAPVAPERRRAVRGCHQLQRVRRVRVAGDLRWKLLELGHPHDWLAFL